MNEWERQQLSEIGQELEADPQLSRLLGRPSRRETLWLQFRSRFYPTGFLGCSVAYMVSAIGPRRFSVLLSVWVVGLVVGLVVWLVVELRAIARD